MKKLPILLSVLMIGTCTVHGSTMDIFSEDLSFFTKLDPSSEGDRTTDATTWDIVEGADNPFGDGKAIYIKDTTTTEKVELSGHLDEEVNGPVYASFKFQGEDMDGSIRALKFRIGNEDATAGGLGSGSRSAVTIELRQNEEFRLKGDDVAGDTTFTAGQAYQAEIVANFDPDNQFTYTLHGQTRTLDPFHWDAYLDEQLVDPAPNGFDFTNKDWGTAYNNAGAKSLGFITDTSNTGGEFIIDDVTFDPAFGDVASEAVTIFSEDVSFFSSLDPDTEGDHTSDATTWDIIDEADSPFGAGKALYVKDTTTEDKVGLEGDLAEEVNGPLHASFKFQGVDLDGSSRAVKFRIGNQSVTGGNLGSESRTAVTVELRQNNEFRLKGDQAAGDTTFTTGQAYDVDIVANFDPDESLTYELHGNTRTLAPFRFDAYLDGTIVAPQPDGFDFSNGNWADDHNNAGAQSIGIYTDTSNTGGEFILDEVMVNPAFKGVDDTGGPTEVETFLDTDFEDQEAGTQPDFEGIPVTYSPSSNTDDNGIEILDDSSDPVSPLDGKSMYVYDFSGDLTTGDPTHMRFDFNGGNNVDNLRFDVDFQVPYTVDEEDTDTRVHIGVGRAGAQTNNSDFRPFEIRIHNQGDLEVNYNVDGERSSDTVTTFDTASRHSLTFFANSHDTFSYEYDDGDLGTGVVKPNTMHLFVDGSFIGEYLFLNTPDPDNAPEVEFFEQDEDLGRIGFYQDSKRQGGVIFDNLRVGTFSVDGFQLAERSLEEPFEYADGLLRDTDNWSDSNNTTDRAEENSDNISVSGEAVSIAMDPVVAQGSVKRSFLDSQVGSGTYHAGLEVTVDSIPDVTDGSEEPAYFFGFTSDSGNTERARLWVTDQDNENNRYKLGITSESGSQADIVKTGWLSVGQTYNVVTKLDWDGTDMTTTLWVNPVDVVSPMVETTEEATGDISGVFLRQDDRLVGNITVDNVYVGEDFIDVFTEADVSTPPAAPTDFSGSADSDSEITLTWTDNADDEIGYIIQREGEEGFVNVGSVLADETSFTDTGLNDDTAYTYRLLATNGATAAADSDVTVTTDPILTPVITGQPESKEIPHDSSTTLSVDVTSEAALTYQWYEGTSGDTSNPITDATSGTYTTPSLNGTFEYWVRITNEHGSIDSETATVTTFEPRTIEVVSVNQLRLLLEDPVPGDTYLLEQGYWEDVQLEFSAEGTEEAPITIAAKDPGRTIFTGDSWIKFGGDWIVLEGLVFTDGWNESNLNVIEFRGDGSEATNSRVTNCAIVDYSPEDISGVDRDWVGIYGEHNRVDNCFFGGHATKGVTMIVWHDGQPNHHQIDHNHFYNRGEGSENGWETLRVGTSHVSMSESRTVVEYNLFEECDGEIEIISSKTEENVYRYNTFLRSKGMLTLRHGNRCVVDGNYFLGEFRDRSGGIRVIGEDHVVINNYISETTGRDGAAITVYAGVPDSPLNEYFAAHNALIAFNTIVDVEGPYLDIGAGFGGRDRTVLPTGVTVANNLFDAGNETSGSFLTGEQLGDPTYEGNIAFGRDLGASVPGFTVADPLLEVADDTIYRPTAGSPAIDSAVGTYDQVTMDIDGQERTGTKDVGADEDSSESGVNEGGPILASSTGPEWMPANRFLGSPIPENYFGDTTEVVSGILELDWFGMVNIRTFPWIVHNGLGWLYAAGQGDGVYLFFAPDIGWTYVAEDLFPLMYDYKGKRWLYFHAEGDNRYFYDYKAKEWFIL